MDISQSEFFFFLLNYLPFPLFAVNAEIFCQKVMETPSLLGFQRSLLKDHTDGSPPACGVCLELGAGKTRMEVCFTHIMFNA